MVKRLLLLGVVLLAIPLLIGTGVLVGKHSYSPATAVTTTQPIESRSVFPVNNDKDRRSLYPVSQNPKIGTLSVGGGHELYYEESGNENGQPALFLHGGPAAGTSSTQRGFFDPAQYRIVLFDQRGAGKSKPAGEIANNTTADLVADIELLRRHLKVKQWVIYGGSWGSTLALAYAEAHPEAVKAMVLRGIFLARRAEIEWSVKKDRVGLILTDSYERFENHIPKEERGDLLAAYHRRIMGTNTTERDRAIHEWDRFEDAADRLVPKLRAEDDPITEADINRVRILVHYLKNGCFLEEGHLLKDIGKIRHIPAVIIHGRYDLTCPFESAWALHQAWPEADFRIVPDAGHSWREPGIIHETILATDRFR